MVKMKKSEMLRRKGICTMYMVKGVAWYFLGIGGFNILESARVEFFIPPKLSNCVYRTNCGFSDSILDYKIGD